MMNIFQTSYITICQNRNPNCLLDSLNDSPICSNTSTILLIPGSAMHSKKRAPCRLKHFCICYGVLKLRKYPNLTR
eukprot:Gb_36073 [translate_table: standard]